MTVRYYSSVASEKTLTGTITAGQATLVVSNTIGLPGLFPYTLSVDYETVTEELVQVESAAGTTLTVTRGIDGTSATSHTSGARVRHVSSARDFSDSRNHENSADGVHGLAPGEELVGTDKIQTLSNKTLVDAQGSLKNIDMTIVPPAVTTIAVVPAASDANTAVEVMNGADQTLKIAAGGRIQIRNTPAQDSSTTAIRFGTLDSNGTTERFTLDAPGRVTSTPRPGTADTFGSWKMIEPGDSVSRKMIALRNSADTVDKFVVRAAGGTEITLSSNAQVGLNIKGAASMGAEYLRIVDSADVAQMSVDSGGRTNAFYRARVQNAILPASSVLVVAGHATQSARLTRWENNTGTELAYVDFDGTSDFNVTTATSGAIVPASGWALSQQRSVIKAGVMTINLNIQRTGGPISATATGDLTGDPALGTLNAAYRPDAGFGNIDFYFGFTDLVGTGSGVMNPSTGDMNIVSYSGGGTINTNAILRIVMTYPL